MRKQRRFNITWPGFLLLLPGLLVLLQRYGISRHQIKMNSINENAYEVFALLLDEGFFFGTAKVITAQAAFETANFTSKIYRENNNPFGMKLPVKRRTTAKGEKNGYAFYESVADAVRDFYLWYDYMKLPENFIDVETYVNAINFKGYFESDVNLYKNGVQKYYKLYFS